MEVLLAKNAGACYGVQRALDMAAEAQQAGLAAVTLGPIIHNPRVVRDLAARGISPVESVDEVQQGSVIIRSHGVVPQVKEDILARGLDMIDATCPHVARAQKAAADLARDGYLVLVVGEAGHPEVEGLCAYARKSGGSVVVANSAQQLPAALEGPVGVVVQTTQMRSTMLSVVDELERRGLDYQLVNTICSATTHRQDAATALAGQVDAMVVVGGRNSSNTTRLYDICKAKCANSHHIEDAEEIDPAWFKGVARVGVTAGASTPEDHIAAVISALEAL